MSVSVTSVDHPIFPQDSVSSMVLTSNPSRTTRSHHETSRTRNPPTMTSGDRTDATAARELHPPVFEKWQDANTTIDWHEWPMLADHVDEWLGLRVPQEVLAASWAETKNSGCKGPAAVPAMRAWQRRDVPKHKRLAQVVDRSSAGKRALGGWRMAGDLTQPEHPGANSNE